MMELLRPVIVCELSDLNYASFLTKGVSQTASLTGVRQIVLTFKRILVEKISYSSLIFITSKNENRLIYICFIWKNILSIVHSRKTD